MRYYVRQLALFTLWYLGLITFFRFIRRNQITILMIHGVMDEQDNPLWRTLRPRLSRKKLEAYLEILSRYYHFVSLSDAVEMLQGKKPMQPYSIVLTFDDGYKNNLKHALPVLRRFNAPATFFIPTGFLDNPRPFWFDRLDYAFQQMPVDGREVKIGSFSICFESSNRSVLYESYKRLRRMAKRLQMSDHEFIRDMEKIASDFEAESGKALSDIQQNDDWSALMTWEQIKQIGDDDVTIGSHTVDHIRLGLVESNIAHDQLTRSKLVIEERTGKPCKSLSFPNGSYNNKVIALAKDCGYTCCLTTDEGLNRVGCDVMKLRRIGLPLNINKFDLLFRLSVTCS